MPCRRLRRQVRTVCPGRLQRRTRPQRCTRRHAHGQTGSVPPPPPCTRREAAPARSSGAPRAPGSARTRLLGGVGWGERPAGHRAGEGGRLPQCAPPPKPVCPDGERGRRVRAGCACAPPPGAIKASPPAATSASSCREKPVHLLQRQLLWTWTPRPALALLVVPVPATAPASVRDANAPPARRILMDSYDGDLLPWSKPSPQNLKNLEKGVVKLGASSGVWVPWPLSGL
ncbi:WAS/WASL-interacting protein family member 2-like [Acinonyx jubatus]|uniref:WAS/WASL-interacting protein family member 2-like n=1 Tax=Acinonyx jubatus TaxID=32536 RepID=A0ABM3P680_ACIJB|nr:WAS/WASL-interacting protein family member 2-like [Acinonyx jubatus]